MLMCRGLYVYTHVTSVKDTLETLHVSDTSLRVAGMLFILFLYNFLQEFFQRAYISFIYTETHMYVKV